MPDYPLNSDDQPGLDELITLSDAAQLSGLSSDHLRRLVRQGDLWGKKIGRNWVTTTAAVQEYIARDRKPGPKPQKSSS
jgi:excisionase family DNA binding protein